MTTIPELKASLKLTKSTILTIIQTNDKRPVDIWAKNLLKCCGSLIHRCKANQLDASLITSVGEVGSIVATGIESGYADLGRPE